MRTANTLASGAGVSSGKCSDSLSAEAELGAAPARSLITWPLVIAQLLRYKKQLALGNACSVVASLSVIPIPMLLPILVDELALELPKQQLLWVDNLIPAAWEHTLGYLLLFAVAALLLRLLAAGADLGQGYIFINIAKRVTAVIRERLLGALRPVAMVEFEMMGSGQVASRLITDVNTIDELIAEGLGKFVIGVITVLGVILVVAFISPGLALFLLVLNPAVIYFTARLGKRVKALKKDENRAVESLQRAFIDTFDAIQQIRVSNAQGHFFGHLGALVHELRQQAIAFSWQSLLSERFSSVLFMVGFDLFRALALALTLFSDLTVGQMFAVFAYLWIMMGGMQQMWQLQYKLYSANGALERLNQLGELELEAERPRKIPQGRLRGSLALELQGLSFHYPSSERMVLRELDLRLEAGSKTAICGDSGGGKSTLVQLLAGLYPPLRGRVLVNGFDLNHYDLGAVRERMAVVLQQPALLNSSLRNNLSLGAKFSDRQLWQALTAAALAEFVATLPQGLDSLIGNHGVRLSGGQRQRLAIARAILPRPGLIVFDEATSALDAATEAAVHSNLASFLEDTTVLIIAHRQSALSQADQVYKLEAGGLHLLL